MLCSDQQFGEPPPSGTDVQWQPDRDASLQVPCLPRVHPLCCQVHVPLDFSFYSNSQIEMSHFYSRTPQFKASLKIIHKYLTERWCSIRNVIAYSHGNMKGKVLEKVVLKDVWYPIRVASHQCALSSECGLLSVWPFIGVVFHQGGLIRMVFCQGGLSPGWSFIRVAFYQGGFSSRQGGLSSGWPLIGQDGLSSGWSPSRVQSFIRVVFHQNGLSSRWFLIGQGCLIRLVFQQGVFFFIRDSTNTTNIVDWTSHLKWQFNISSSSSSFSSFNLWMLHWFSGQLALMWWSTYMTSCETPVKDCARDQLGAALPGWCWLVLCLGFERVWKFRKQQCKD